MRLFITGATGLIGSRLVADRMKRGDEVWAMTRSAKRAEERLGAKAGAKLKIVEGDPMKPGEWQRAVDGCDAVANLAGAGIADKRWSEAYKRLLRDSRIETTRNVVQAVERAHRRPRVMVNASAVGYYGDTGEAVALEATPASADLLGEMCVAWEREAEAVRSFGVRVVQCRFGVVLDRDRGALPKMALPFRLLVGGPIGSGRAFVPWVHVEDAVGAIGFVLDSEAISGPVNVTAPEQVRNADFSRALARGLGRPCWLPVPRFALRIVMGEVAEYATASCRAVPGRLQQFGYTFTHPQIDGAMQSLLGED